MTKTGVATILGIVSLMISVIALCVAVYRTPELSFDYQGVLIGILSLLVTVLIGWQIYTFIDINKRAIELSKLTITASLNTEKSLAISEDGAAGIYYYLLLKEDPLGLEYQFLYHKISSLLHTSNFDDIEACNSIVRTMLEMIVNPSKISMIQSCRDKLLILLTKVKSTDKIIGYSELVEKIARVNVVPRQSEAQN
ncbi:MAG: hypothetical protein RR313_11730 [Anaerovoracaceae bacterium]